MSKTGRLYALLALCCISFICSAEDRVDPTRPVTQGMDKAEASLKSGFAQVMDVAGFNYRVHRFDQSISRLPQIGH